MRSKLAFALASIIVVPIIVVVIVLGLVQHNMIQIPSLQGINITTITLNIPGKDVSELEILPLTLLGVFFITMIAMVLVVSKVLSDFLLMPLKELNYAAERIGAGDFDFNIRYEKDNEFGKLCREFNSMKDKLHMTSNKQRIYENSRKELIASITHDLKTPLTSIIGYVEGLQDGVVTNPDTVNNYLQVIHDKSQRLDHLIDDLFTFTQLELEKFTVNMADTSMELMLTEYSNTKIREYQSNKKIAFISDKIFDAHLNIDEFRIGQVLENLISNAEKYTNSYIKLYTTIDESYYNIYVEDDGIGIGREDLPYIFEYFYQCDKARETIRKGTGLGLAICKQLVEAHKGRIYVRSTLGEGTVFKISLKR
jgi:signal transduction histidine kinase